ncbi:LytR C-terminal domain-containing protein [Brachybacterium sp. YJGR34]|uniref:LytR C-terminal domain-containing protein n=1 Tax=Brachybacterium sp. YJGR34 TaxID=2059911 RepID=UPI000E0B6E46|nr:LytR C-terminal domain-containing protein [Brachybacterium sp. YJGR34]
MPSSHRDAHPYGRSADDVRRRDQRLRRTRRLRATQLAFFSILSIVLIGIGAYAVKDLQEPVDEPGVISQKTFESAPSGITCPEDGAVPLPPGEVSVTVLNGTTRTGLAGSVTEDLAGRGYAVGDPGNTRQSSGPATVVFGPSAYLAARSVAAQVTGEDAPAQLRLDESREGSEVDLLLGTGFTGLIDEAAATEALAQPVESPEGC